MVADPLQQVLLAGGFLASDGGFDVVGVASPTCPALLLPALGHTATVSGVSTLAEIEAAIGRLPAAQVDALALWLAAQRARRAGPGTSAPDDLESLAGSWQEDPVFDSAVLAFEQVDEAMWR